MVDTIKNGVCALHSNYDPFLLRCEGRPENMSVCVQYIVADIQLVNLRLVFHLHTMW